MWIFSTMRGRMGILLLVLVAPILTSLFVGAKTLLQERIERELAVRTELADGVRAVMVNYLDRLWSVQGSLGHSILSLGQNPAPEAIEKELMALGRDPALLRTSWITPEGVAVVTVSASGRVGTAINVADRDYFRQITEGADHSLSDLLLSRVDEVPVVAVARGIRVGDQLHGVLVSTLNTDALTRVLPRPVQPGGVVGLVDREARVVYRSPVVEIPFEDRTLTRHPAVEALRTGRRAVGEFIFEIDGLRRLGAAVPIEQTGWVAFASIDKAVVMGPVVRLITVEMMLFGWVILLGGVLVMVTADSFLRPLQAVRVAAETAAAGDLDIHVPPSGPEEVAAATQAFNRMAERIRVRTESERQAYASEISRRESNLRVLLDHIAEGVLILDSHGKVWIANEPLGRLLGVAPSVAGIPFTEVGMPPELETEVAAVQQERSARVVESLRTRSGRWCDVLLSPATVESRELLGLVIILRDVTEAVQVRETQKRFVANVSHEIRGPLASIAASTEALLDGLVPHGQQKRFLRSALDQVRRIERMAAHLLELSRMDTGTLSLTMVRIDVAELCEEVLREWRELYNAPPVRSLSDGTPHQILADRHRLKQVINIFLDNARKFTPPEGEIELRVGLMGREVVLSVHDTGVGIAPDHLSLIWEAFYTTDPARRRSPESGTGLGLALAKGLVERMGGRVGVESAPGAGSAFSCSFPAQPFP